MLIVRVQIVFQLHGIVLIRTSERESHYSERLEHTRQKQRGVRKELGLERNPKVLLSFSVSNLKLQELN